jgi:excinuclease UvrABC ATPase subunit
VIVIEHNLEIIKNADWIIDMGPEGGHKGGKVLFEGTPQQLLSAKHSLTSAYLQPSASSLEVAPR